MTTRALRLAGKPERQPPTRPEHPHSFFHSEDDDHNFDCWINEDGTGGFVAWGNNLTSAQAQVIYWILFFFRAIDKAKADNIKDILFPKRIRPRYDKLYLLSQLRSWYK